MSASEHPIDVREVCKAMESQAAALIALCSDATPEQWTWRPAPGKWSMLEVLGHLDDEERLDFRVRIECTLNRPGEAWPGIDPEGWVTERAYNDQVPTEVLARFAGERRHSLSWIGGLGDADWAETSAQKVGLLSAGDLLLSWRVHDLLHLRQLCGLRFAWATARMEACDPQYAGGW